MNLTLDKLAVILKYPINIEKPGATVPWRATIVGQYTGLGNPFCIGEGEFEKIMVDQAYDWLYHSLARNCGITNL